MAASSFPFLTDAQFDQLLANGLASQAQADFDLLPVVKLFTPDAGATWLLSEIDPKDPDIAFGLCDLGLGFPEPGCASLSELSRLRGMLGLPIEQDLHFRAERRLRVYAKEACSAGRIRWETRHVFTGMFVVSAMVLIAGSILNGEFARVLAASAGIRFRNPVDFFASAETCTRVQRLALDAAIRGGANDWSAVECVLAGTRMHAEVQVRAGGRWFVQPLALGGVKVPETTERLSVPDAGLELVLPSLPRSQ